MCNTVYIFCAYLLSSTKLWTKWRSCIFCLYFIWFENISCKLHCCRLVQFLKTNPTSSTKLGNCGFVCASYLLHLLLYLNVVHFYLQVCTWYKSREVGASVWLLAYIIVFCIHWKILFSNQIAEYWIQHTDILLPD